MRKILFLVALAFIAVFFQNCKSGKTSAYIAPATLSYDKDIAPILQTSCIPCHFPPKGRKEPLDTYEAVKENIAEIIAKVKLSKDDKKFMPPLKSQKPALNDSLIHVLETWQKQSMPK